MIRHRLERPDFAARRLCSFGITESALALGVAEAAGAGIAGDIAAGAIAPELAAMAGETALSAGVADAGAFAAGVTPAFGGAAAGSLPASLFDVAQGFGNVYSGVTGVEKLAQGDPSGLLGIASGGLGAAGISPFEVAGRAVDSAGNYLGQSFDVSGSTIMPGADIASYSFTPGQLSPAELGAMKIGDAGGYPVWAGPSGAFDIAGYNVQQLYDPQTNALLTSADPGAVDAVERAYPNIQRFNTQSFETTPYDPTTGQGGDVVHAVGSPFDNPYYVPDYQGPLAALLAQAQAGAAPAADAAAAAPAIGTDVAMAGGVTPAVSDATAPLPALEATPAGPTSAGPQLNAPPAPNPRDLPIVPGGMSPNQIAGVEGGGGAGGGTGGTPTGGGIGRASFGGADQLVSGSGVETLAGGAANDTLPLSSAAALGTNISTGATPLVTTNVPDAPLTGFSPTSGGGAGNIVDAFGQDTGIPFPNDYKGFTAVADGSGGLTSTAAGTPSSAGLIERTLGSDVGGAIKDIGGAGKDILPFASAGLLLNSLLGGGAPLVPPASLAKTFPETAAPVLTNAKQLSDFSNTATATAPAAIQTGAANLAQTGSQLTSAATQPLADAGKSLTQQATALSTPLNTALTGDKLTLPAGAEAAVQQGVQAAKASIRSKYAKLGMSGSTAEVQELNAVDTNAQTQRFGIATQLNQQGLSTQQIANQVYQNLLSTGTNASLAANQQYQNLLQSALQAGAISGADYKALLQTQIGQDQALQSAIANFVAGLSGTSKTPSFTLRAA